MDYLIVFIIGACIGIAELVKRYSDAPIAALRNYATVIYALVNSIASVATLLFLNEFNWVEWEGATPTAKSLVEVLIAGLGASAILRIGLSVQVAGHAVNVSLMSVLEPILKAADNEVDRARATERLRLTQSLMQGLDTDSAFNDLPPLCVFMLQGLSDERQKELANEVKKIREWKMKNENIKLMNLGLVLLNTVGADVLEKSVSTLKEMGSGFGAELHEEEGLGEENGSNEEESIKGESKDVSTEVVSPEPELIDPANK